MVQKKRYKKIKTHCSVRNFKMPRYQANMDLCSGWVEFLEYFMEDLPNWQSVRRFINYKVLRAYDFLTDADFEQRRVEMSAWSTACFFFHENNPDVSQIVSHPVSLFYFLSRFVLLKSHVCPARLCLCVLLNPHVARYGTTAEVSSENC